MQNKGYIAGSLFSEAEIAQRLKEGQLLRDRFPEIEWFNPIEAPINDKAKLPTAADIFKGDTDAILDSKYIVADLANNDPGVMYELGMAWGLNYAAIALESFINKIAPQNTELLMKAMEGYGVEKKVVLTVSSDIRQANAGEYDGKYVPFGLNQFVVGGIESMNGKIFPCFSDILEAKESKDE